MKRFHSSSLASTLTFSLIAGLIVLGGCTADTTLTGPTPETEENVTVQETTQNQNTAQSNDDDGNMEDEPEGHN